MQLVQLADHPGVVLAQGPAPVGHDAQNLQPAIAGDRVQPFAPGGGQRDRVRVRRIGLAPCPALKTLVRAGSFGGTSCLPTPRLPSNAQI